MVPAERRNAFARAPLDEPRRGRKALRREIAAAVIDQRHVESGLERQRRERPRVVARSEDAQHRRRLQRVDEDRAFDPGGARGWTDRRSPGVRAFDHGRDREGLRGLESAVRVHQLQGLRRGKLRTDRLHEDVDRAFAAEAETPDRLVVGPGVVMEQARAALAQQHQRVFPDIGLEAAAADPAARVAALFDEELRAGSPIRRTVDADHGRDGRALAGIRQADHAFEDRGRFAPPLHVAPWGRDRCSIPDIGPVTTPSKPWSSRRRAPPPAPARRARRTSCAPGNARLL